VGAFLRSYGRWIVLLAIVAFLAVFARRVDWAQAWASIRGASPSLLAAAFVANGTSILLRGIRWWIFLRPAGAHSLALALRATVAGGALNNVLLAQGGEAARVVFVARAADVPAPRVLATLALERMFDTVGFVVLLAFGGLLLETTPEMHRFRLPAMIVLVVITALIVVFLYMSRGHTLETAAEAVADVAVGPVTLIGRGRRFVSRFATSARALATPSRFAVAFGLSLIAWLGQLATYHWCAVAAGISLPLAASLAALLAANVGFLIRATPGSVGVFQVLYAVTVVQFGVDRDAAVAASLLIQTLQIVPLTIVGVALAPEFIFRKRRARLEA
jgi:glycosyltransferase 2 family protein